MLETRYVWTEDIQAMMYIGGVFNTLSFPESLISLGFRMSNIVLDSHFFYAFVSMYQRNYN